jgi:hypothetical protein
MYSRKQLVDTIEGYDAEIEALQKSKRETYDAQRADLIGNMGKDQVRDEIDALKKAVQRRRQITKHGVQVVEDKDALVEEILAEVEARVARGARAREIIEEFPASELRRGPAGEPPSPHGSSADQSTAARTDVQQLPSADISTDSRANAEEPTNAVMHPLRQAGPEEGAGTQAPPVDTNSQTAGATVDNGGKEPAAVESLPATGFKPGSIRYERTPAIGIVRHDYQRCFPEAWGPALGDLKDDIRANGIREPILMQGNILLDGWSRFMAARDLQVDYPVQEYDGTDPLADIIKLNMASRKLNLAERVSIARKLIKAAPDREADIGELLDLEQVREAAQ